MVEERSDARWMLTHCWKKHEWEAVPEDGEVRHASYVVEEARLSSEKEEAKLSLEKEETRLSLEKEETRLSQEKEDAGEALLAEKATQTEKIGSADEESVKDTSLDRSHTQQQDSKKPVARKKSSVSLKQKLAKNLLFRYKYIVCYSLFSL